MNLADLHFLRPELLWLILPASLAAIGLWALRRRSGDWSRVIAPHLLPALLGDSTQRSSRSPLPLLLALWVIAAVAAAGPSVRQIPLPIHQKQDALVLVLDLSYSMYAEDLSPSRLLRARQKLLDLLRQRTEGQTGLIAYAGDSHIVSPLTDDNPTIANLMPALRPDIMPVPGSDPVAAVDQALELLQSAGIRGGNIVLVTDGVTQAQADEIAERLSGRSTRLQVMGVGTDAGAPIPLPRGGFLKDGDGTIVTPGLDRTPLRQLVRQTRGVYTDLRLDDSDISALLTEPLLPSDDQTLLLDRRADAWEDQGYVLLLLLLPGALLAFRRGWLTCIVPLALLGQPGTVEAFEWQDLWQRPDQRGAAALEAGDAERAAELFEDARWSATASYEAEQYERAREGFSAGDRADDWYNRGNALAQEGNFEGAIEAYEKSLQRLPGQSDAEENIALLEELMKQQQQQQQQQQNQQNDESQDEQQNEQNQDQQNQDQEGQDQQEQGSQDQEPGNEGDSESEPSEEREPPEEPEESEKADAEEEPSKESEQDTEQGQDGEQEQPAPAAVEPTPEELEDQQAMEQWLRRVPDDPAGLLREKFRYESRQRQVEGERKTDNVYW